MFFGSNVRSEEIFCEICLEGSREGGGVAEKAWVAGCPLKVPKGQFPVKYTRTVPRRDAWVVSGREINIKADRVYEGKYRNILFTKREIYLRHFTKYLYSIKISLDSGWSILLHTQNFFRLKKKCRKKDM